MTKFSVGRFGKEDSAFLGLVIDGRVTRVTDIDPRISRDAMLLDLLDDWEVHFDRLCSGVASGRVTGEFKLSGLQTEAPHPNPRQIFCTGANYKQHVREMVVAIGVKPDTDGMDAEQRAEFANAYVARQIAESSPFVFMKPVTALSGPFDPIALPPFSQKIDWELELGVVLSRTTHDISAETALAHVAGYMVVNDITARDKVFRSEPGVIGADWLSGKGYPGFLPTGPLFVPASFVSDPHRLAMQLRVNGEVMQDDSTNDMIFDIGRQISFISKHVQMLPGDLLCTGSPAGNGIVRGIFLKDGDVVEGEIEGLGAQRATCRRIGPSA